MYVAYNVTIPTRHATTNEACATRYNSLWACTTVSLLPFYFTRKLNETYYVI